MLRRDMLPLLGLGLLGASGCLQAQESYAVFQTAPRLLLSEDRLRLLRREHERGTERWRQLETLVRGGAPFPEPVFAYALAHLASGDESLVRKALDAVGPKTSSHEIAILVDWCGEHIGAPELATLETKLKQTVTQYPATDASPAAARNVAFAAIALADKEPALSAKGLGWIHKEWWPTVQQRIDQGVMPSAHRDALPFVELLYAFQRGLQLDLRESAITFFREYPIWHLLRHYPPSYAGGTNDYRVPAFKGEGEPNLDDCVRSRAAELAMVALDTNATESQYLQGWLLNPRFRMRNPMGAAYEFFWCNPYQPSLSYFYLPLYQHLPQMGSLLVRSSWEENAVWIGLVDGDLQLFTETGIQILKHGPETRAFQVGPSAIILQGTTDTGRAWSAAEFPECQRVFWLGLKPSSLYEVEIDGEELTEIESGPDGIVALNVEARGGGHVYLRPSAI